jgi:hypothetical protein
VYARLARVIFASARANPIVQMNSPYLHFCWAKTCSTAQRTEDLRAFARAFPCGIALLTGLRR